MDARVRIELLDGARLEKGPTGPSGGSGEPIAFDAGKDEVVFGREPGSDVVFPPDQRIVSRKHFRLYRQASGHYAIEIFGNRYVELNGTPATSGEVVSDGDVIRLGGKSGPAFRVAIEESHPAGGLERTLTQAKVVRSGEQFRRLRQTVGVLAVVVIAVGIGSYFLFENQAERIDALAALQEEIGQQVADDFDDDVVARLSESAYAVVLANKDETRTLLGTAWPVKDGWVATNAHVANKFDSRGVRKLLVVHPGGDVTHTVIDNWIHPGYATLKDFRSQKGQADADFSAAFRDLPQPSGYDIALLKVDNPEALGAPLDLASPEEIAELGPGDELAYVGYPVEGTVAEKTTADNPQPSAKFGYVSSLTDFFLFRPEPAWPAYLIRHSIPATGGASGSPIFNAQGHVVGVLSGGTVFEAGGKRQASAVLENFGQRIDLLDARFEPEETFNAETAVDHWTTTVLPRFGWHREQIIGDAKAALEAASPGQQAVETLHLEASLGDKDAVAAGTAVYAEHDVDVTAGQSYTFLAYGEIGRSLSVSLFRGDKPIGLAGGGSSFASIDYPAEASETLSLRVLGEKKDPVAYELIVMTTENANTAEAADE